MAGIEGIRSYRALEQAQWLQDFKTVAPEIVGEDALVFEDDRIGIQELEVMGASKFMSLRRGYQGAECPDGKELAKQVEEELPASFPLSLSLIATGELNIKFMRDLQEEKRRVLTADIHQARIIVNEQKILESLVDAALGVHPTRRPVMRVKLATVNDGHVIPERDLQQLAYFLPDVMRAQPGEIEPVTIGPDSFLPMKPAQFASPELEAFSQELSLDAAQSVAEAQI